jgi:alpha-tubulin suppressor-like RCC1 family protein
MGCLCQPNFGDGPVYTPSESVPLRNGQIVQVACGRYHTIFYTNNKHVLVVGNSEFGQLGNGQSGENVHSRFPVKVDTLSNKNVTSVSSGLDHCLALTSEGRVYGWFVLHFCFVFGNFLFFLALLSNI